MIETERLILRPWTDADRAPFIAMSANPAVMETLGGVLSEAPKHDTSATSLSANPIRRASWFGQDVGRCGHDVAVAR